MNIYACRVGGSAAPSGDAKIRGFAAILSSSGPFGFAQGKLSARSTLPTGTTMAQLPQRCYLGGVVEWLMAPVLKTGRAKVLVGSNPTPSALPS